MQGEGRQTACEYVVLRFQYARKALLHKSVAVHWLTHVGDVFQALINSRVLFVEPFATIEALVYEAMQDQKGILARSPDCTLIFLHTRSKLTVSLAHRNLGYQSNGCITRHSAVSAWGGGSFTCTSAFR